MRPPRFTSFLVLISFVDAFQTARLTRNPVSVKHSGANDVIVGLRHSIRSASFKTRRTLLSSTSDDSSGTEELSETAFDFEAVGIYGVAIATEVGLFAITFKALDTIVARTGVTLPFIVNLVIFYFMALKSRAFNPLSNNRPKPKTLETDDANKRKMPTWTPPGFIFPIMWLLVIGPLRATAASMVVKTAGCYFHPAILALSLHLSVGDVWNTINNIERRYGTSVLGVIGVWASKAFAAYQFYQVNALAGKLLGVTLVWLSIATALITRTWQLNPEASTGKVERLLPMRNSKEACRTKFAWFAKA